MSLQYLKSLDTESQRRYKEKLFIEGVEIEDPYVLSGWVDDITKWPSVEFGDIYTYLIEFPNAFSKEAMKAFKSLDAYNFFASGHVQTVLYNAISGSSPVCLLKAKVTPSQRIGDKAHEAWVCCMKTSSSVNCAHCTCMAG